MYKKILVPYDGSKPSSRALDHAVNIAKMFDSKIIILHVIPEILMPPTLLSVKKIFRSKTGEVISSREYLKELYNDMKKEASIMLNKKIKAYDACIETRILIGNPVKHIVTLTKKENVDLIVMGTSGLSGLSRLKALGSVSRNVIENSKVPVLLIS